MQNDEAVSNRQILQRDNYDTMHAQKGEEAIYTLTHITYLTFLPLSAPSYRSHFWSSSDEECSPWPCDQYSDIHSCRAF